MSASRTIQESSGPVALRASTGIRVTAATHPFKAGERYDGYITEGATLLEILHAVQPDKLLHQHAVICINCRPIPREYWHKIKPRKQAIVTVRVVPCGGGGDDGGKNPLRTILTLAVVAAAYVFGGPLGSAVSGALGLGETGAAIATAVATAAITGVGLLAVNALVPINYGARLATRSGTSSQDSPTLFITGARNSARPFQVIPVVLGKHKQVPPYGALPYTEIVGNDQYVRMVFLWGYGPLKIEDIKIGDTPIGNFDDVEIYTRQGYLDDPGLQIFTEDVFEENLQILLTQSGGFTSRFTTSDTDEASVDFVFGAGLVNINSQGVKTNRTVEMQIEYKKVGDATWYGDTLAVSAQDSPSMPAEPGTKKIMVGGVETDAPADNPHRIDLVVIDKVSGVASIIKGETAFGAAAAVAPSAPSTKWPIAEVYRDTSANVTSGDITDVRTGSEPFGTPATDFAATEDTPASDQVALAAGTLTTPLKVSVTRKTTSAVRVSKRFRLPERAQYEIRCKRITADTSSSQIADRVTWSVLRSFTDTIPLDATGLATTEVRIRASDQLNNVIDQLSGVCTSILPDYDSGSGTWKVRETQNPASLYRAVLQGPANKRPIADSRIDLDLLEYWHDQNAAKGYEFNMVRDFASSVWDTLVDVAAAGFASPQPIDGKYGVVIDEEKSSIVQHFSPRNSRNFKFNRLYLGETHAWRIRFVNDEDEYRQDERIVYDDGYNSGNATKFEELELPGVTDPDQVWKAGRQRIAEQRLRPERYTIETDVEHLICTRGDRVLLSHDVISVGIKTARIKSVTTDGGGNATAIEIDEAVPMEVTKDYGVSIRTIDNNALTGEIVTVVGEENTLLTFKTPIAAANIPEAGDLVAFGEAGSETLDCLVLGIEPITDLGARLALIPYAEAVFAAAEGTIPTYTPNISQTPGVVTPFVIEVDSDEKVLLKTSQGDLLPRIKIVLSRTGASLVNRPTAVEVQIREDGQTEFRSIIVPRQESFEIFINEVEEGITYDLKLRYLTENGEGPFSSIFQHTVIGTSTLPEDVTDVVTEGPFLRWAFGELPLDFRGFKVRTSLDTDTPWESAQAAHAGYLEVAELNIGNFQRKNRIFLVKAFDQAGNESENAATLIRDANDEPVENVQRTVDLDAGGYPGTITGGTVVSTELRADGSSLYLPNDNELYLPTDGDLYLPDTFAELIYITQEQTISSSDGDSQVKVDIDVVGTFTIEYKWGKDGAIDTAEWRPFPGFKDVQEDDKIQFRVRALSAGAQTKITNFDIIIDVEDESESQNNVAIGSGGTRLTLEKAYRTIKVVAVTIQGAVSGDYAKVVDKQATAGTNNGPLIEVYDNTDTKIAKTVDVIIQGVKA